MPSWNRVIRECAATYKNERVLQHILFDHELNCLARGLKYKFNDPRSIEELKAIMIDEYKLNIA